MKLCQGHFVNHWLLSCAIALTAGTWSVSMDGRPPATETLAQFERHKGVCERVRHRIARKGI